MSGFFIHVSDCSLSILTMLDQWRGGAKGVIETFGGNLALCRKLNKKKGASDQRQAPSLKNVNLGRR